VYFVSDVVEILLENKVVDPVEPAELLTGMYTVAPDLAKIKNLPDEEFFYDLITYNIVRENLIDMDYFNKIVYTGDILTILVPTYEFQNLYFLEKFKSHKVQIKNNGKGITNGQIIRTIADNIPNTQELKDRYMQYIINHPEDVYEEINEQRSFNRDEEFDEKYPKSIINKLMKDPKQLAEYLLEREDRFIMYDDEYDGRIYFGGLYQGNDGVYPLHFAS